ncbi:MAG TPA: hypothetical protein VGS03_02470 [Candidatus Polarisedimenticolia bacterium]|jgi:hypothetical protein|nr:hypothetical protein [Candidatus Polarisedimenticolia bacterium]
MKKTMLLFAGVMFAMSSLVATPAHAQAVRDKSCTDAASGVTWDCDFVLKSASPGTPVSFAINYSCTSDVCGPVLSFGLGDPGFSPADASGHLVGGSRLPSGLELTFAFDSVKESGVSGNGHVVAHFVMNVMTTDASGGPVMVACPVDVRLNEFANKSEDTANAKKKK